MPGRILVVEDDLLNRMFYCEVLRREGYDFAEVGDGAEMMQCAHDYAPDLVIMDINLPNVSGLELIERIKADAALQAVPVLAVTAYVGKQEEARIRQAGAGDFLAKPVTIRDLVGAIGRLLS